MKKKATIIILALMGIGFLNLRSVVAQATSTEPSVREVLKEVGDKYDYYFTIESGFIDGNITNTLERQKINKPSRTVSAKDALRQIQQITPNFAYQINTINPKIIFVYDTRLLKRANYGIEKLVNNFSFDGSSMELLRALEQSGIPVSDSGAVVSTDLLFSGNLPTPFHIRNANMRVRDLLTNSIQLTPKRRILWTARTDLDSNKKTYVRYD